MDSDSSSDEELDLMAFVVAAIAIKKGKENEGLGYVKYSKREKRTG